MFGLSKKVKIILALVFAVIFLSFVAVFAIAMSNRKTVVTNNADKTPVVISKQIRVTSSVDNILTQKYTSRISGQLINLTKSDIEIEVSILAKSNITSKTITLTLNWQTITKNGTLDLSRSFSGTDANYEIVESVTIKLRSNHTYLAPYYQTENKYSPLVVPSIIILVIAGSLFGITITDIANDPKIIESETNRPHQSVTVINQTIIENSSPTPTKKQEEEPKMVTCEYCNTLNKLDNIKCTCCGANLKQKVKKQWYI